MYVEKGFTPRSSRFNACVQSLSSSTILTFSNEALCCEPRGAAFQPWLAAAKTDAVAALLKHMQVERYTCQTECVGELKTVLHFHNVVFLRVPDEARRRVFRHVQLVRQLLHQFRRDALPH